MVYGGYVYDQTVDCVCHIYYGYIGGGGGVSSLWEKGVLMS